MFFWYEKFDIKEKVILFVDFKESRFFFGLVYFLGLFIVIVEDDKRIYFRKSRDSIMSKILNGYSESVESLFMDRNGLLDNYYLFFIRVFDNFILGIIKKWLICLE